MFREGTGKNIAAWALLCIASAAPSFFLGRSAGFDEMGIVVGVIGFMLAYAILELAGILPSIRKHPAGLRAIRIAIATRIFFSVFPLCYFIDMFCGSIAISVAGVPVDEENQPLDSGFGASLSVTLIGGFLSNALLWMYGAMVYCYLRHTWVPKPPPEGICQKCGYDLRASPVRCPECGEPRPPPRTGKTQDDPA